MHDRDLEVEPYKSRMLWNGAFRCKGQKARSHFDWLQADEFKRLDERPFGERQFVVEEIPVCAANIADIGLEDKQTSARSEAGAGDALTLQGPRPLNLNKSAAAPSCCPPTSSRRTFESCRAHGGERNC